MAYLYFGPPAFRVGRDQALQEALFLPVQAWPPHWTSPPGARRRYHILKELLQPVMLLTAQRIVTVSSFIPVLHGPLIDGMLSIMREFLNLKRWNLHS